MITPAMSTLIKIN